MVALASLDCDSFTFSVGCSRFADFEGIPCNRGYMWFPPSADATAAAVLLFCLSY